MTTPSHSPGPDQIMQLATGYWASRTLLTASRVGVFAALAEGPRTAAVVAAGLGLAERPTRLLLQALTGLGLLEHGPDGFGLAAAAAAFLVPGRPAYLGDALSYADDLYDVWGRLDEALVSGEPALPAETYLGSDSRRTAHFVRGMHNRALAVGQALPQLVDLSGCRRLLDVGGGPGTFSALIARANPRLQATVADLPEVVAVAREILAEMGAGDRVRTLACDYHRDPFPEAQDAVLIAGVLHRESPASCRALIAKARVALVPGGLLVISDVMTDADGCAPVFATLFGLNMMLTAPDGGVHSSAAVRGWLAESGLEDVAERPFPPPMPHRVLWCRKPVS